MFTPQLGISSRARLQAISEVPRFNYMMGGMPVETRKDSLQWYSCWPLPAVLLYLGIQSFWVFWPPILFLLFLFLYTPYSFSFLDRLS